MGGTFAIYQNALFFSDGGIVRNKRGTLYLGLLASLSSIRSMSSCFVCTCVFS